MNEEKIRNLIAAIEAAETKEENKYAAIFSKIFDPICKKFKGGATQKEILQILMKHDLKISATAFRVLMESECANRGIKIDKTKKGAARYQL